MFLGAGKFLLVGQGGTFFFGSIFNLNWVSRGRGAWAKKGCLFLGGGHYKQPLMGGLPPLRVFLSGPQKNGGNLGQKAPDWLLFSFQGCMGAKKIRFVFGQFFFI